MPTTPRILVSGAYSPESGFPPAYLGGGTDGTNFHFRTYEDMFLPSGGALSYPPSMPIVNMYNGSGLRTANKYFGATWHNWPNVHPDQIRLADDGQTVLNDCGLKFGTARSHDHSPNSLGSLRWYHIETSRGVFQWTNFDKFVEEHYAAGRDIIFTLFGGCAWASTAPDPGGDPNNTAYKVTKSANPPDDMADWSNYCTAVATRAAGRIRYWQVWNEANIGTSWFNGTVAQLSEMHRRASQAIKAVDPNAQIVSCPSSTINATHRAYMDTLFGTTDGAGGFCRQWVDVVAFHMYYGTFSLADQTYAADLAAFRTILQSHGLDQKPLFLDELGLSTPYIHQVSTAEVQRRIFRMMLKAAATGVAKIVLYDMDSVLASGTRYAFLGAKPVAEMVRFFNASIDHISSGDVTVVNALWDGRVAYVHRGTKYIV